MYLPRGRLPDDMRVEVLSKHPKPGSDRYRRWEAMRERDVSTVGEAYALLEEFGYREYDPNRGHKGPIGATSMLRRFVEHGYVRLY